jgi:hypothetical protein
MIAIAGIIALSYNGHTNKLSSSIGILLLILATFIFLDLVQTPGYKSNGLSSTVSYFDTPLVVKLYAAILFGTAFALLGASYFEDLIPSSRMPLVYFSISMIATSFTMLINIIGLDILRFPILSFWLVCSLVLMSKPEFEITDVIKIILRFLQYVIAVILLGLAVDMVYYSYLTN